MEQQDGPLSDTSDTPFTIVDVFTCGGYWRNGDYSDTIMIATAYGNSKFVAVGDYGSIASGSNGINWIIRASGQSYSLRGVTYANNLFAAVGGSGTILTSPDTVTWTPQTSGVTDMLRGIAYGNGFWTIVSGYDLVLTSSNPANWNSSSLGNSGSLMSLAIGSSVWVAIDTSGGVFNRSVKRRN